jgi:general secretion pathway protein A
MYAKYFGLEREPFSIAPDPKFLFMSERHREALAHLMYGVKRSGGGFVLLTGEIGAGKTTVCRALLNQMPKRCNVAYVFNPKLSALELLQTVCEEFHVPIERKTDGPATAKEYIDSFNQFLLRTHAVGQNNVLIVDEAQNLEPDTLEQLRLLTNLETDERKLLQIVLIGQPELRDLLARPELEQVAQRIIARYHLEALSLRETAGYVRHRMAVAGLVKAMPFSKSAIRRIHERSRGVPRRINLLADRSLLGTYSKSEPTVDETVVDQAADEVFGEKPVAAQASAFTPLAMGIAIGLMLATAATALWLLLQR